ncbi:Hypothetical predicted protein [Lecanosticta acicola]|uniref:Uncharacterized protein n=1 Tax=Lecanosticta acicola TaxID=111012 RepID=A0AAI9EF16_9PEZI|nr:Hypothetical predicted protein [Lecanosticta acicola]
MSSNTHELPSDVFQPIPASRVISSESFAEAIKDLPLDTLYAKAAELQNSISHLLSSNIQMKPFADEGDRDCVEAIEENDVVIKRHEERIELLKVEAERRGLAWSRHGDNTEEVVPKTNGATHEEASGNGRLTDEELRRRLEEQMSDTVGEDDEDGVHL